eukprot:gene30596-36970_t
MGCTSSSTAGKNPNAGQPTRKKAKKASKDSEAQDMTDLDVHKMREDILQRHDSEVDIIAQISAEREALKAISSVKIERPNSCEDLAALVSQQELHRLCIDGSHFAAQRKARASLLLDALRNKTKPWVLFNNQNAWSGGELEEMAAILLHIIRALQTRRIQLLGHDSTKQIHPSSDPAHAAESASADPAKQHKEFELSRYRRLERCVRALPVVTIAPVDAFVLAPHNREDFTLPPGLVTLHEARLLIELFRQGGKLSALSVHKLLRLAFASLKPQPNVRRLQLAQGDKLTIVGDLHGQLADLLHILDTAGLPGKGHVYIFNGDFVDRGPCGVEVMCVLLALLLAVPDSVVLNRGNHEDFAICSVYGFQLEVYEKYDPLTFGLFVEVFQQLPLFCVVQDSVFVVHGGLFHNDNVSLADLQQIDRMSFTLEEMPEDGEPLEGIARERGAEYLQQLIRDALWSDPIDMHGKHHSARGAGLSFGVDVTEKFLLKNNLKFIVRSHECVRSGYDEPYVNAAPHQLPGPLLCTIFSASDYGGSGNSAAYLQFSLLSAEELAAEKAEKERSRRVSRAFSRQYSLSASGGGGGGESPASAYNPSSYGSPISPLDSNVSEAKRVAGTELQYTVHYFYASALPAPAEPAHSSSPSAATAHASSSSAMRLVGNALSLEERICMRKHVLLEAFEREDCGVAAQSDRVAGSEGPEGLVSQQRWLKAMQEVLDLSVSWRRLARYLVREEMTAAPAHHHQHALAHQHAQHANQHAHPAQHQQQHNHHSPTVHTACVRYLEFLGSYDDDVVFGAGDQAHALRDNESVHNMPTHSVDGGEHQLPAEDADAPANGPPNGSATKGPLSLVYPAGETLDPPASSSSSSQSLAQALHHTVSQDVVAA